MGSLIESKTGRFVKLADSLKLATETGQPMSFIKAGVTVVYGPFRLVVKDQIARVTGIVTESMINAKNNAGEPVYEFQGNGWRPQARVGDILLQDVESPSDRWACGSDLFGGTGWVGAVHQDLSITYAKPGKPVLALELPEEIEVMSREGTRVVPTGCMLAITNVEKGDFYIWTPDVVEERVRDYQP